MTVVQQDSTHRFDPYSPGFLTDPYRLYAQFRQGSPVNWGIPPNPEMDGSWYLFRYDDVMDALRDPQLGREWAPHLPPDEQLPPPEPGSFWEMARRWIVFRDPPEHTRLRSLLSQAFTPRRIAGMTPVIEEIAQSLVDDGSWSPENQEFIGSFAFPLPVLVIAHVLGIPGDDRDQVRAWSADLAPAIDIRPPDDPQAMERATDAANAFGEYLRAILDKRRARPGDDLLSALLASEEDGERLTEDELIANAIFLLLAGHETTVNLLGSGMLAFIRNPNQWSRLQDNPVLLPNAVEEMLRYASPVQITFRTAFENVTYGGAEIRAGEDIGVVIGAANRDPEVFDMPDEFDIDRNITRHAAFGRGIHFCLGSSLARLEAEIAFRTLLTKCEEIELAGEPMWKPTIVLRGIDRLPVNMQFRP